MMTDVEKFGALYRKVMDLEELNPKGEPVLTLRRIRWVLLDAVSFNAIPVTSEKFEMLYKQVMKQFKPFEDMERIENPRLVKRHIKKVVETACSLSD